MAMTGDLSDFSLANLLQVIERGGKSGQLSIQTPNGIYTIWFYQGRIVATASPNSRHALQYLLGESQTISDRAVTKLASFCPSREPLGLCLKRQSLISPTGLTELFRQQLQVGLYPLFDLDSGRFRFDSKASLPYGEMTGLSKGAMEAALEGLRRGRPQTQTPERLPEPDQRFIRTHEELPMLRLSPAEWSILENISPHRRLREISFLLEEDLLVTRQICAMLLNMGLIEIVEISDPEAVTEPVRLGLGGQVQSAISREPILIYSSGCSRSSDPTAGSTDHHPNPTLLNRLMTVLRRMR